VLHNKRCRDAGQVWPYIFSAFLPGFAFVSGVKQFLGMSFRWRSVRTSQTTDSISVNVFFYFYRSNGSLLGRSYLRIYRLYSMLAEYKVSQCCSRCYHSVLIDCFYLLKIQIFFFFIFNPADANTVTVHTSHCTQLGNVFFVFRWILITLKNMSNAVCKSHFKLCPVFCNMSLWTIWQNLILQQKHLTVIRLDFWIQLFNTTW